ncbi:hypothetical protein EUGRSUZ_J02105 [Eucalyptus grandis]|uniref:Uncharacterized protein n=1 Tax=Eucalyptus grandis TaxID=71139 RepID=A0ACC3J7L5_EUCGR|nr:hypothetical protein EUGRSUZ_J02105 [Eucalyptus grandis]
MGQSKKLPFDVQLVLPLLPFAPRALSTLYREYIGAEFKGVQFSDVPIHPGVEFPFILSFAIDYDSSPSPTNGWFNVASIKSGNSKVKVALPADHDTFTGCIGRLTNTLKSNGVISFASIAPYTDDAVQSPYLALWSRYGQLIDYVNFQFYAYDAGTSVSQFIGYFEEQSQNYGGGKVLVSFISDGSGRLSPEDRFFTACEGLKSQGKLHGIFALCADDSMAKGFKYEQQSQALLAISR